MSSTTITVRITFALARDRAFPGSSWIAFVHPLTQVPIYSILLIWFITAMVLLLPLAATQAFYSITGITTIGFQWSYCIPIFLRFTSGSSQTFEAFDLGWFSLPCAFLASNWLFWSGILFFWPTKFPVTAQNMNYTIVVMFGFLVIGLVYWWFPKVGARHHYTGPIRHGQPEPPPNKYHDPDDEYPMENIVKLDSASSKSSSSSSESRESSSDSSDSSSESLKGSIHPKGIVALDED